MNPIKKSIIGSILVLTSLLMYYNFYRSTGMFELFSWASIFLLLGSLAAAQSVETIGNKHTVNKNQILKHLDNIIK